MKPMYKSYCQKLIDEGLVTQTEIDAKIKVFMDNFEVALKKGKEGDYDMVSSDFYND